MVVAGDDEDGGAAAVTEGAAAAVVLVDGEEDGEVRRIEGIAKVVSACIGGVGTGQGEDGGARCSGDSGFDGAAAPMGPRGENRVKRMCLGKLRKFTEKRGSEWSTSDEMLGRVAQRQRDANEQRGG